MEVDTTVHYEQLMNSNSRISVMQGGTRSGKTYNIIQYWICRLLSENNKTLTICRLTMPSIRNTVFIDFQEIMQSYGLWDSNLFIKSEMTYYLGSNKIQFRNLDDDQKIRGAKRDYLYVNEANEISLPVWKQLIFRTSGKIVIDYNPSDEFHWIYDEVIPRTDCDFFKSTYKDNKFLSQEIVTEIERLKDIDLNYWKIYGLGERGMSESTIFTNWELLKDKIPDGTKYYGLDFGFNDPNALVEVTIYDGNLYVKELLYKNQLTTPEIINELKELGLKPTDTIFGDNSRPETIQEIHRAGFNCQPCVKGKGSIKSGIDWIKRNKIYITPESTNLLKEIKSYKWKTDKNERVLDEPVDLNNHLIDALRYSLTEMVKYGGGDKLLFTTTSIY